MNEVTTTKWDQSVFRRLTEPFKRFGAGVDESYFHFADKRAWAREELEAFLREPDPSKRELPEQPLPPEFWQAWLKPNRKFDVPADWDAKQKERLNKLFAANLKLV